MEIPFSFTRNPLYLAGTTLVLGIGLVSGIAWFLLLAVLAAFAVQKLAIERDGKASSGAIREDLCGLRRACAAVDLGSCVVPSEIVK